MLEPQKYRINLELMQYKPKFWECIRALCVLFICSADTTGVIRSRKSMDRPGVIRSRKLMDRPYNGHKIPQE
jgi:hypothetical protein